MPSVGSLVLILRSAPRPLRRLPKWGAPMRDLLSVFILLAILGAIIKFILAIWVVPALPSSFYRHSAISPATTSTVNTSISGHARHGRSWMAYDISLIGDVGVGAARSGATGWW